MITSAQNPKLKLARQLMGRPRDRQEAGAFVAEGVRLVEEALAAGWRIRTVLHAAGLSGRASALVQDLQAHGIETDETAPYLLEAVSDTGNTQGILAILEAYSLPYPEDADFVLITDQVRDPGNLGTLLRSAAAAGAQAVLLPPETTDAFAPKVVRSGMGAHFRLPIHAATWEEIERRIQRMSVLLADMGGTACWECDLRSPLALIIGGEAGGASPAARRLAQATIGIPMPGGSESLNAANAGTVLLFEVVRQRRAKT